MTVNPSGWRPSTPANEQGEASTVTGNRALMLEVVGDMGVAWVVVFCRGCHGTRSAIAVYLDNPRRNGRTR